MNRTDLAARRRNIGMFSIPEDRLPAALIAKEAIAKAAATDLPEYTGPDLRDFEIAENDAGMWELWFDGCEWGGEFVTREQAERFALTGDAPPSEMVESLLDKIIGGIAFIAAFLGLMVVLGLQ